MAPISSLHLKLSFALLGILTGFGLAIGYYLQRRQDDDSERSNSETSKTADEDQNRVLEKSKENGAKDDTLTNVSNKETEPQTVLKTSEKLFEDGSHLGKREINQAEGEQVDDEVFSPFQKSIIGEVSEEMIITYEDNTQENVNGNCLSENVAILKKEETVKQCEFRKADEEKLCESSNDKFKEIKSDNAGQGFASDDKECMKAFNNTASDQRGAESKQTIHHERSEENKQNLRATKIPKLLSSHVTDSLKPMEGTLVPQSKHAESTLVPQSKHSESTLVPQSKHAESTLVPQSKHAESTLVPQSKHAESILVPQSNLKPEGNTFVSQTNLKPTEAMLIPQSSLKPEEDTVLPQSNLQLLESSPTVSQSSLKPAEDMPMVEPQSNLIQFESTPVPHSSANTKQESVSKSEPVLVEGIKDETTQATKDDKIIDASKKPEISVKSITTMLVKPLTPPPDTKSPKKSRDRGMVAKSGDTAGVTTVRTSKEILIDPMSWSEDSKKKAESQSVSPASAAAHTWWWESDDSDTRSDASPSPWYVPPVSEDEDLGSNLVKKTVFDDNFVEPPTSPEAVVPDIVNVEPECVLEREPLISLDEDVDVGFANEHAQGAATKESSVLVQNTSEQASGSTPNSDGEISSKTETTSKIDQENLPALIELARKASTTALDVQLASLKALGNISWTVERHMEFLPVIGQLMANLDSSRMSIKMESLRVLMNLSRNPAVVPYMLATKAPSCLLKLLLLDTNEDVLSAWLNVLADILWTAKEQGLTYSSLPTDVQAASPETVYNGLYGLRNARILKSRVFVLSRHRNQQITLLATRIYSNLVS